MRRFWVPSCGDDREVELPAAESRHAERSLRLPEGAPVVLFDGTGREWEGTVARRDGGRVMVRVGTSRIAPPAAAFSIATALPKGSRLDWMVEKLAELGAASILPVRFRRSTLPLSEAKRARLERIAVAAAKQSGRATLPEIAEELTVDQLCHRVDSATRIASPSSTRRLSASLPASLVIVGPEGGIVPEEEEALTTAGAIPVSLGRHVLRIETASVAAAAVLAQQ